MLDVAVLRRTDKDQGINVPLLLDTLLFYSHVHLILDRSSIIGMMNQIGPRRFRDLISLPSVTFEMTPQFTGSLNETVNGRRMHKPIFASASDKPEDSQSERFFQLMSRVSGYPPPSRDFVRRLIPVRRQTDYARVLKGEDNYNRLFYSLAEDVDTVALVIEALARRRGKNLEAAAVRSLNIRPRREGEWVFFESDIPLDQVMPKDGEQDEVWGAVSAELHEYAIDMQISQTQSADILTSAPTEEISRARLNLSLMRASDSAKDIKLFSEATLERGGILSSALESGEIDFDRALKLIEKCYKLREWIGKLPPDADLLQEYYREIARETALNTVPVKGLRYAFITGGGLIAGLVSPILGLTAAAGLGFFDTFLLDGIARGWRPNAFVRSARSAIKGKDT